MRASPIAFAVVVGQALLLSGCENKEERRLAELQSHCSSIDANYSEDNANGCTALLAEPSLANPVRAMTYNTRGNTYDKLKKHELAIADYKQAIQLHPDFAYAYANVGLQYA